MIDTKQNESVLLKDMNGNSIIAKSHFPPSSLFVKKRGQPAPLQSGAASQINIIRDEVEKRSADGGRDYPRNFEVDEKKEEKKRNQTRVKEGEKKTGGKSSFLPALHLLIVFKSYLQGGGKKSSFGNE
eukprot:TRINITY_DN32787_c0_g1_i1.p1 TRINITY_DN32787_c0_g1~~TRINITY_DN32787_c0_g1_i1.p1  ORF type:complete len:128 (-),score=15.07 TRINITY_DN32787_c0_g1_i1:40-423(-)